MIRAAAIALAALVLVGAAPAAAPPQQGVGWQGLAYRNDGRFHILSVDDAPSEAAARAELRRECARRGFSCDVIAVVTDCLATAYSEASLSFFTAAGPTRQSAINAAYGVCASNGGPCDNDMSVCPTPVSRPPTRTPAPRPAEPRRPDVPAPEPRPPESRSPEPRPPARTPPSAPALPAPAISLYDVTPILANRGSPLERSGADARGRYFREFTAAPGQPASRITYEDCVAPIDCSVAIFSQQSVVRSGSQLSAADLASWNDRRGPVRLRLEDGPGGQRLVAEMTWRAGGSQTFAQAVEAWAKASAEAGLWLDEKTRAGAGSGW